MSATPVSSLADRIDALLPQTQCTKCGFDGCRPYADAIAGGRTAINRCPPGGAAGIAKLAVLTERPPLPLDPVHGVEQPLRVAVIDESLCIGCTLCIQACPVDAIIGAARRMHSVIARWCNGCDLCIAPCPMDCIAMVPVPPPRTWSGDDARQSRERYLARKARLVHERVERDQRLAARALAKLDELEQRTDLAPDEAARKQAVVRAAIERARARRASTEP
jgi:electron transport complex protein RnfB